jgi:hypothetical protein
MRLTLPIGFSDILSFEARIPLAGELMGRTMPSWRIIVQEEITRMARFRQFLRAEERAVFDDLLAQCRLYASAAGVMASSIKEVPLLLSMIFAQHKRLVEIEKRVKEAHS